MFQNKTGNVRTWNQDMNSMMADQFMTNCWGLVKESDLRFLLLLINGNQTWEKRSKSIT